MAKRLIFSHLDLHQTFTDAGYGLHCGLRRRCYLPAAARALHIGGRRNASSKNRPGQNRGDPMKRMIHAVSVAFAMLMLACFTAVNASAQCGASDGHLASNTA